MTMRAAPVALLALVLFLSGCVTPDGGNGDLDDDGLEAAQARLETSKGDITIEFFCDAAPETVENFHAYAADGFYSGTVFHRIIAGFMIQGGGFTPQGEQKQTRAPVPLEYSVPNERGTVAMARTSDPNSATSQFFINTVDNTRNLGPGGADAHGYTVFARVVDGMDVVDAIAAEPTGTGPQGMGDWPVDPPVIQRVGLGAACDGVERKVEYGVEAGLIAKTQTDSGVWETRISADPDYVPLWILNTGSDRDAFSLTLEAPDGWNVSLSAESEELARGGSTGDAAVLYLTVRTAQGSGDAEIRVTISSSADANTTETLVIAALVAAEYAAEVSAPGSDVTIGYRGSFESGEEFDAGSFATVAGSQQTVAGFSFGMVGLELEETVHIRFPPSLGYGYSPPAHLRQFAGEWLNFEITIQELG